MTLSMVPALAYVDPPELDHIIHLVAPGTLSVAIEQFTHLGFSVERGGVHADGLTQNALIVLTDGVYIELIEFLEKPLPGQAPGAQSNEKAETLQEWRQRRSRHWWWGRPVGWTDWCLRGGVTDGRVDAINRTSRQVAEWRRTQNGNKAAEQTSDTGKAKETISEKQQGAAAAHSESSGSDLIRYNAPQSGGRRAWSGKDLKWKVTFPTAMPGTQRGTFPFWCEDETPRWWRVPTPSPPHANRTQGLSSLTLLYHVDTFPSRLASLQLILSSKQNADQGGGALSPQVANTLVDARPPPKTEGRTALPDSYVELYLTTPDGPLLPIRVKAAEDPAENAWLDKYGEGLFEVEISVAPDKLPISAPPDGIERETAKRQYGRLRLHPLRTKLHSV